MFAVRGNGEQRAQIDVLRQHHLLARRSVARQDLRRNRLPGRFAKSRQQLRLSHAHSFSNPGAL
jgi:hypothetical protein